MSTVTEAYGFEKRNGRRDDSIFHPPCGPQRCSSRRDTGEQAHWFRDDDRRLLFKAEERGTGEDWAEVVACHLCRLIGLPHVEYELAAEYDGDRYIRPGVVCENMAPKPIVLATGNELLLAVYQTQRPQQFKVRQHAVDAVCEILSQMAVPSDAWTPGVPAGVESALDVFVGYVMLDAWIANQDRHHENWVVLRDGEILRLAPDIRPRCGVGPGILPLRA